jgi:hypothetical protein
MATEIVEQIVREAPDIEAVKVGLLADARTRANQALNLPAYQAAALSPTQRQAAQFAQAGLGSYQPYLDAAGMGLAQGQNLAQTGAQGLARINVAPEFTAAQQAMQAGMSATGQLPGYAQMAGTGYGQVGAGSQTVANAVSQAGQYNQANLAPSQNLLQSAAMQTAAVNPQYAAATGVIGSGLASGQQAVGMAAQAPGMAGFGQGIESGYQAALQSQLASRQPGFDVAAQALAGGIGGLQAGTGQFTGDMTQQYMNPYQQDVINESIRQINRQGDIAQQGLSAQAVRAGAFGGTREGVQRAELERALSEQRNAAIVGGLQSGYTQAQQTAQQAFEAAKQRQMASGQGIGALGSQFGQLAATQAGLGQQAAQQMGQAAQLQTGTTAQQAALQQQAAQQAAQYGQLGLQAGQTLGGLETQQAQLGLSGAGQLAGIGQTMGQQAVQQAQLGQAGTQLYGSLGAQQAQMGLLPAQIAAQQAAIAGQGAQLYGQLGQGIGALGAQRAGVDYQTGMGLGQLGSTIGQLGIQQAAIGQAKQQLGAADVSMLSQLGGIEQQNAQQQLDAQRATDLQRTMAPYQQLAFLSDIYKGAPSSQMTLSAQSAPSTSPLTQAVGLGISGLSAAAGAQKLFG